MESAEAVPGGGFRVRWGLKGDPETDADRRQLRVFWDVPDTAGNWTADALDRRAAVASLVGNRRHRQAPLSTPPLLTLLARIASRTAFVAFRVAFPPPSVCLAVAEPATRPDAPNAPPTALPTNFPGGLAATA